MALIRIAKKIPKQLIENNEYLRFISHETIQLDDSILTKSDFQCDNKF